MLGLRTFLVAVACIVCGGATAVAQEGVVHLALGTGEGTLGEYVSIPVNLTTNGTKPTLIAFDVVYDATKLQLDPEHIEAGPALTATCGPLWNKIWPDKAAFVLGGYSSALGDGVLCYLKFRVISLQTGTFPVEFGKFEATDYAALYELPGTCEDGWVLVNPRPFDCNTRDKAGAPVTASVAAGFPMAAALLALGIGRPGRIFRRRKL